MKNQDIFEIMERFEACGIARMKLEMGDTTLELEKDAPAPAAAPVVLQAAPTAAAPAPYPVAPAASAPAVPAAASAPAPAASAAPAEGAAPAAEELPAITAPLVGTFYVAPSPDKAPYVQVGDKVKAGDTVCLLEAMKMMSEVTAPCDCVIEEIVAQDGALVSYGDPLIRYREA